MFFWSTPLLSLQLFLKCASIGFLCHHIFFLNFGSCFIPQAEVSSLGFVLSVKFFVFSEVLWGLTIQYLNPPALISNGRVRILLCMRIILGNICVSLLPKLIEVSMSSLIFCGASMLHTSLAAILYSCQEKVISYNVNDMVFESISFLFFSICYPNCFPTFEKSWRSSKIYEISLNILIKYDNLLPPSFCIYMPQSTLDIEWCSKAMLDKILGKVFNDTV